MKFVNVVYDYFDVEYVKVFLEFKNGEFKIEEFEMIV